MRPIDETKNEGSHGQHISRHQNAKDCPRCGKRAWAGKNYYNWRF